MTTKTDQPIAHAIRTRNVEPSLALAYENRDALEQALKASADDGDAAPIGELVDFTPALDRSLRLKLTAELVGDAGVTGEESLYGVYARPGKGKPVELVKIADIDWAAVDPLVPDAIKLASGARPGRPVVTDAGVLEVETGLAIKTYPSAVVPGAAVLWDVGTAIAVVRVPWRGTATSITISSQRWK